MFKYPFLSKRSCAMLLSVLSVALVSHSAIAANPEPVVVGVEFVTPFTLAEVNALNYGLLDVNLNTETIIIGTDDALSGTGNPALVLGGTQEAAEITVTATASQAINILVDNVTTGTGYGIDTFVCDYDGGADSGACDVTGLNIASSAASAALLIGATLTGDGTAVAGAQNGGFDVTVSYQ